MPVNCYDIYFTFYSFLQQDIFNNADIMVHLILHNTASDMYTDAKLQIWNHKKSLEKFFYNEIYQ